MSTAVKEGKTISGPGEMFHFLTTHNPGIRGVAIMFVPKDGQHQKVANLLLKLRQNTFIHVPDTDQSQNLSICSLSGRYIGETNGFVVLFMKPCPESCLSIEHLNCLERLERVR